MTETDYLSSDNLTSRKRRRLRIFISSYLVVQGLVVVILAIALSILIASGDPPDLSPDTKNSAFTIGIWVISIGVAFFLGSVLSSLALSRKKPWAKYLILIFLILGSFFSSIALAGLSFLSPFALILILMILITNLLSIILVFRDSRVEHD